LLTRYYMFFILFSWFMAISFLNIMKRLLITVETQCVFFAVGTNSFYLSGILLGVFAKLQKETINFIMSICPSVHMEQLSSHWKDFHEIWLNIFRKSVEKIQVSLHMDKNNWYFTWQTMYIFYHISLSSSYNEKSFRCELYRKSKHTIHFW